jgi:sugar phosphate isomerase/epimerase
VPAGYAPTIAVSSWSLHRTIGLSWWDSPASRAVRKETWGPGNLTILDLPAAAARHGIRQFHLCHFHVESRDDAWLGEFRAALADAGVTLSMLLIDDGDISHPTEYARDVAWVGSWIDTAAALGAKSARVVAGKQTPSPEALRLSAANLNTLARRGKALGVRVATENWLDLTPGPGEIDYLLDSVGGDLGLLADFGTWKGASRYRDLEHILARSEDTHAKASFTTPGVIDADDFGRCLGACEAAGYAGPYTLIYEGEDSDEWAAIAIEKRFVEDWLGEKPIAATA